MKSRIVVTVVLVLLGLYAIISAGRVTFGSDATVLASTTTTTVTQQVPAKAVQPVKCPDVSGENLDKAADGFVQSDCDTPPADYAVGCLLSYQRWEAAVNGNDPAEARKYMVESTTLGEDMQRCLSIRSYNQNVMSSPAPMTRLTSRKLIAMDVWETVGYKTFVADTDWFRHYQERLFCYTAYFRYNNSDKSYKLVLRLAPPGGTIIPTDAK